MAVHPNQLVHFSGGECLERYGTLVKSPVLPVRQVQPTFSRSHASGAVSGLYPGSKDGILRAAEADVPRVAMLDLDGDGEFTDLALRLEGGRTNDLLRSEEFDNASWTKTRVTVTADATTAPDGTSTADKIVEDTASGSHVVQQAPVGAETADTEQAFSVHAKAAERTWIRLVIIKKDGTQGTAFFDLENGAVGTTSNTTRQGIEALGDGWYRCRVVANSLSGATSMSAAVNLADADNSATYTGDGSSGVYLWGAQFETDKSLPSSYIPTAGSAVTRNDENFTAPYHPAPQALSIYAKLVETGGVFAGTGMVVLQIGSATPNIRISVGAGDVYRGVLRISSDTLIATLGTAPAVGDTVELLLQLGDDAGITILQSINGAATTSASDSTTGDLPSAWADRNLHIAHRDGSDVGYGDFRAAKVAAGVHSMSSMRAAY